MAVMKRLLSIFGIISCFFVLCSCDMESVYSGLPDVKTVEDVTDEIHVHDYSISKYTETEHWFECECGAEDTETRSAHKGGYATCEAKAICTVCEQEYGETAAHNYNQIKSDETKHWNECACGEIDATSVKTHRQGMVTCGARALCVDCGSYYGEVLAHSYTILKSNGSSHWYECGCGAVANEELHKGGEATCTEQATCSVCNKDYGPLKDHVYGEYQYDENAHWYECECGAVSGETVHHGGKATEDKQAVCSDCGQSYGDVLGKEEETATAQE